MQSEEQGQPGAVRGWGSELCGRRSVNGSWGLALRLVRSSWEPGVDSALSLPRKGPKLALAGALWARNRRFKHVVWAPPVLTLELTAASQFISLATSRVHGALEAQVRLLDLLSSLQSNFSISSKALYVSFA